jgi:hypothetical protein
MISGGQKSHLQCSLLPPLARMPSALPPHPPPHASLWVSGKQLYLCISISSWHISLYTKCRGCVTKVSPYVYNVHDRYLPKFLFSLKIVHNYMCKLYSKRTVTQYTECQAFCPIVRIGSLSAASEYCSPLFGSGGDTLAGGGGAAWRGPMPTKGQTFWYSMYTLIPLRVQSSIPSHRN